MLEESSQENAMLSCRQTLDLSQKTEKWWVGGRNTVLEQARSQGMYRRRVLSQNICKNAQGKYWKRPIFLCKCNFFSLPSSSWSGSNIRWGQAFRLRHLTTGHYLALTEDQGLILQDRGKSDTKSTAFSFRASKVRWILTLFSKWKLWNFQVELWLQRK